MVDHPPINVVGVCCGFTGLHTTNVTCLHSLTTQVTSMTYRAPVEWSPSGCYEAVTELTIDLTCDQDGAQTWVKGAAGSPWVCLLLLLPFSIRSS